MQAQRIAHCREWCFCSCPRWPWFKDKLELDLAKLQVVSEIGSALMQPPEWRGAGPSVVGISPGWQKPFLSHMYWVQLLSIFHVVFWFCISLGRGVSSLKLSIPSLCVCLVTQSFLTLCDPVDCSPPVSSVHEILQARILEWVAMPSSRGSSQPSNQTQVSCIAGGFFTIWATREAHH